MHTVQVLVAEINLQAAQNWPGSAQAVTCAAVTSCSLVCYKQFAFAVIEERVNRIPAEHCRVSRICVSIAFICGCIHPVQASGDAWGYLSQLDLRSTAKIVTITSYADLRMRQK